MTDLATSATQVGPHRDNVVFELDGRDAGEERAC
jgi:recombinational DNA repair ATPase RecF